MVSQDFFDAPVVAIGERVYVTWATNKSGNWEVFFSASNDNGATFGPILRLASNGTIGGG